MRSPGAAAADGATGRRLRPALALAGLLAVAAAWWAVGHAGDAATGVHEVVRIASPSATHTATAGAEASGYLPSPTAATAPAATPTTPFERWLRDESSLRGTELDGDWGVDAQGALRPSKALRRRFDMLSLLTGEATDGEIERFVATSVERQAGARAAGEVVEAWRRYLALQRHAWVQVARPEDPATWPAAFEEHQRVRRQVLGVAWADAFYRDDEEALARHIQAVQAGPRTEPAPVTPAAAGAGFVDRSTLDADAAARLDAERAEQARWRARLDAARQQVDAMRTAPELSVPQRAVAIDRWLGERFDGGEQRRVRALLGLPAG